MWYQTWELSPYCPIFGPSLQFDLPETSPLSAPLSPCSSILVAQISAISVNKLEYYWPSHFVNWVKCVTDDIALAKCPRQSEISSLLPSTSPSSPFHSAQRSLLSRISEQSAGKCTFHCVCQAAPEYRHVTCISSIEWKSISPSSSGEGLT